MVLKVADGVKLKQIKTSSLHTLSTFTCIIVSFEIKNRKEKGFGLGK